MESILRKELKQWQKAFRQQHGRDPSKRDILQDDSIASTFTTWQAITLETSKSSSLSKKPSTSLKKRSSSSSQDPSHRRHLESTTVPCSSSFSIPTTFTTPTKPTSLSRSLFPITPSSTTHATSTTTTTTVEPPSPVGSVIADIEMTSPDKYTSPSQIRKVLAHHSVYSPNRRAIHEIQYTPRTKARKRLRGEQVPPTPESKKQKHNKKAFYPPFSKVELTNSREQEEKDESDDDDDEEEEEEEEEDGLLKSVHKGSISFTPKTTTMATPKFTPLFASPTKTTKPILLNSNKKVGGLFAAELERRKRESNPLIPPPPKSSNSIPTTTTTANDLESSTTTLVQSTSTNPSLPDTVSQPTNPLSYWKITSIPVSNSDDSDSDSHSKRINILPYQRYGSLRHRIDPTPQSCLLLLPQPTEEEPNEEEEETDWISYSFSHSIHLDPTLEIPNPYQQDQEDQEEQEQGSLISSLVLSKKRTQMNSTVSSILDPGLIRKKKNQFNRIGRNGLNQDEFIVPNHDDESIHRDGNENHHQEQDQLSDLDWNSEPDSEEYGVGNGRMDEVDVI